MKELSSECIRAVHTALKKFGEYTYFDKGPGEVVDTEPLIKKLLALPVSEAADVLYEVRVALNTNRGVGDLFVSHILVCIDDKPGLDPLYNDPRLKGLY